MDLNTYIKQYRDLADNFDKTVKKIVEDNEGYILQMYKFRLYNKGAYPPVGTYADTTKRLRSAAGLKTNVINFRFTGRFYQGMFVKFRYRQIFIDSTTEPQRSGLVENFGMGIFDLTPEEQKNITENIVNEEVNKILANFGTLEIVL